MNTKTFKKNNGQKIFLRKFANLAMFFAFTIVTAEWSQATKANGCNYKSWAKQLLKQNLIFLLNQFIRSFCVSCGRMAHLFNHLIYIFIWVGLEKGRNIWKNFFSKISKVCCMNVIICHRYKWQYCYKAFKIYF